MEDNHDDDWKFQTTLYFSFVKDKPYPEGPVDKIFLKKTKHSFPRIFDDVKSLHSAMLQIIELLVHWAWECKGNEIASGGVSVGPFIWGMSSTQCQWRTWQQFWDKIFSHGWQPPDNRISSYACSSDYLVMARGSGFTTRTNSSNSSQPPILQADLLWICPQPGWLLSNHER